MYREYDTPGTPTYNNNFWFSSQLEARWAVYLDYLGVNYEYESMWFDLPHYKYMPDFWIWDDFSENAFWLEIKYSYPTTLEIDKMVELVLCQQEYGRILYAPLIPPPWQHVTYGCASNAFKVDQVCLQPFEVRDEDEPEYVCGYYAEWRDYEDEFPTFKRDYDHVNEALSTAIYLEFG